MQKLLRSVDYPLVALWKLSREEVYANAQFYFLIAHSREKHPNRPIPVSIALTRTGRPGDGCSNSQVALPGYVGAEVVLRFEDLVANCAPRDQLRFLLDSEMLPGTNVVSKCFCTVTRNAALVAELALGTAAAQAITANLAQDGRCVFAR